MNIFNNTFATRNQVDQHHTMNVTNLNITSIPISILFITTNFFLEKQLLKNK